ncbi:MAG: (deoxy)nucleoside triphosphate pyrophosphohydrolase [Desulfuromonas sp.]|nr:(deoxy)nucleoside triphosphate pyrophosphohydrolase [Desulfuromonas sp.]
MYPLLVTAAVVSYQDKILITQRTADQKHPGLWEFPGGKLEKNEPPVDALQRELREELDLTVSDCRIYELVYHRYDDGPVLLMVYRCKADTNIVQHIEVAGHAWISPEQLTSYDILPADKELMDKIIAEEQKMTNDL